MSPFPLEKHPLKQRVPGAASMRCYAVAISALLLVLVASATGCRQADRRPGGVEFRGRVTEVAPLAARAPRDGRWRVTVQLTKIKDTKSEHSAGDSVSLVVHSVVHAFAADQAKVVGQEYEFVLLEPYAADYSGKLIVMTLDGKVVSVP